MSEEFVEILFYAGIPAGFALVVLLVSRLVRNAWAAKSGKASPRLAAYPGPFALMFGVVVVGIGLAVHLSESARLKTHADAQQQFLKESEAVEGVFQNLIRELEYPADLARSVVLANPQITREQFARFVNLSMRSDLYSRIHGISYVERVQGGGGATPYRMVVRCIEPLARNAVALGRDLGTQAALRAAAEESMNTGIAVLSPRVTLEQDGLQRSALAYFLPVYAGGGIPDSQSERRATLRGWSVVFVVVAELMADTTISERNMAVFRLFDDTREARANLVYDSLVPSGDLPADYTLRPVRHSAYTLVRPLLAGDQVYYLRTYSTPAFEKTYLQSDYLRIAFIGSSLSVLGGMVLWLLLVGRARAIEIATTMTVDLDRLALVARRTSNAVIFFNADGVVTWVNEGFSRITGFAAEEVLGLARGDLIRDAVKRTDWLAQLQSHTGAGQRVHELVQCTRKNGELYWADMELQAIVGSDGSVLAYMSVQNDVTEEVNAKASLEVERERAEAILTGANVGTWERNVITGESHCNERWATMMGFERSEVQPSAQAFWVSRLHPDDRARMANAAGACAQGTSEGYSCDVRVMRKDGTWMWMLSRAKVMSRQADGKAEWIGGIHTDISEFKQIETSLRELEAFLDRAGRIAGVGAWQIDLRSETLIFSDQTCAIHGLPYGYRPTRDEALSFYPPLARQRLQEAMDCALSKGQAWDLELEFINAYGQKLWVRHFGEVEFDDSGAVRLVGAFQDVTNDRKARMEVQRSGQLLRGAIDAINEAFILYDPQDRLVFCNDKFRALYAKSADLLRPGATFESILRGGAERGQYPEAIGQVDAWVERRLQLHRRGNSAMEQQTEDGRWLKVVERNMPDGHSVGFRVDITELKLATAAAESVSAALADERRRLQNILEGTNIGTWEWNVQTGEVIYNDRYVVILGYVSAELARGGLAHWAELTHPDDAAPYTDRLQAHLSGATPMFECELRVRHQDGRWIWLLGRGKLARFTQDGQPLWVYGTHMDITERKLAEYDLAETSATLQNVLDSATQVGIICTRPDRIIQIFNRGAENLLGYRASELIGSKTCSPFFDLAELAVLRESLELAYGRMPTTQEVFDHVVGTRGQQEWTFQRKDGSRFVASLIFSPMRGMQGEIAGHLAVVYDVSRQKEYETSLRQAMVLAEQSSVAKSQFLANMSHEIRTPMNAILGMLQLLRKTALDMRQHDYANKAAVAARSLLGLLNDILDFSKVEAGKMQLDPQPFVLEELLSDLSVILSSNLGNRNVDLIFTVDPAIPRELVGDALRLKQILINLGGNAVKFTQEGEVEIRWTLLARTGERVKLGVAVQDTGIGIALENQARIFEAFTQAESNTTRRFGGTGLGLVISTRLIRLMGSELELVSAAGMGSTFSFTIDLPLVESAPSDTESPVPGTSTKPVPQVLLVDDNAKVRASASDMMRSLGWDVAVAGSGVDALALLKGRLAAAAPPLDAVFVDWQMPEMDGWDTLRQIRRLYGQHKLPLFVLLSRYSREALAQRSQREQELLNGFMLKPLTAGMFAQTLDLARLHPAAIVASRTPPMAMQRLAGMRLLMVEDNLINQQVAQELLAGVGADVTLADNGQLGLDALEAADPPFDAVLMDLQMPVMDGLTAVRLIRKNPRFDKLPVIAMTANAMPGDREVCLQAGMNAHVGKPFDLNDLIDTLVACTGWTRVAPMPMPKPVDAVAAQTADQDAWPAGIDVAQALARMGGNQGLLARSFQAYVIEAQEMLLRLEQQLEQESRADLQRELHSFKGLSGTLGVTNLARLAADAEKCVKEVGLHAPCQRVVAALMQEVHTMLPTLRDVATSLISRVHSPCAPRQGAPAVPQLQHLLGALRAGDMGAMELHSSLRQSVDASAAGLFERLDAAMANIDFEIAAQECEKLMQTLQATAT